MSCWFVKCIAACSPRGVTLSWVWPLKLTALLLQMEKNGDVMRWNGLTRRAGGRRGRTPRSQEDRWASEAALQGGGTNISWRRWTRGPKHQQKDVCMWTRHVCTPAHTQLQIIPTKVVVSDHPDFRPNGLFSLQRRPQREVVLQDEIRCEVKRQKDQSRTENGEQKDGAAPEVDVTEWVQRRLLKYPFISWFGGFWITALTWAAPLMCGRSPQLNTGQLF